MQSIIRQFFDGNIADNELMIKEHSPERIKRLDKLDELERGFRMGSLLIMQIYQTEI